MIWYHFTAVKWYPNTLRVSFLVTSLSHCYSHIICNNTQYLLKDSVNKLAVSLPHLWNVFYKRTKANLEHAAWLHPRKVIVVAQSIFIIYSFEYKKYNKCSFLFSFCHLPFVTLSTYFIAFHILTCYCSSYMQSFIHFFFTWKWSQRDRNMVKFYR